MAIRTKTQRRLWILLLCTVSTGIVLAAAYLIRRQQIASRVLRDRDAGYVALEAGDYFNALHKIGPYIQRNPNDADASLKYAIARQNVEEPNGKHIFEAIAMLRWVLEVQPDNKEARQRLLDLQLSVGFYPEILSSTATRSDAPSLRARAMALASTNNPDAEAVGQRYNDLNPTDLRMQMFTCYQMRRRNVPADQIVARAAGLLAEHPDDPRFQLLLGFTHLLAGNNAEALAMTRKAAGGKLDDSDVIAAAVDQLDQLRQFGESLAVLQRAANVRGDISFRRSVAVKLFQGGRFSQVLELTAELEKDRERSDVPMLAHRAMAFIQLRRSTDAARVIEILQNRKDNILASTWGGLLAAVNTTSFDEARVLAAARSALKTQPGDPYGHLYLGDALARLGEVDAALGQWSAAAADAPTWGRPYGRMLQLALQAGQQPDPRVMEAVTVFAQEDSESLAVLAAAKASAVKKSNDASAAAAVFELLDRIARIDPAEELSHSIRIDLLASLNRSDEARSTLQAVLASKQAYSERTLLGLAQLSERHKLGLEAELIKRSEASHGVSPQLAVARIASLVRSNHASAAVAPFEAAMAEAKGSGQASWQVSHAGLLDLAKDPRAAATWTQAADTNPENPSVQVAALASGSVQADRALQRRIIDRLGTLIGGEGINWRIADARLILGTASALTEPKAQERELIKATTILSDITRQNPRLLSAELLLGECLYRMGKKEAAAEHMEIAAKLAPGLLGPTLQLAGLLQSMNDFPRAAPYLDQAEQILTRQSEAKEGGAGDMTTQEGWRKLATLRTAAGQPDRAIAILKNLNSQDGSPDLGLASMLSRRGELTDEICRKLLERPTPQAIAMVADYYVEKGRIADADAAMQMLERLPDSPLVERELARASYLRRKGDAAGSIERVRAAVAAAPTDRTARRVLVTTLLLDGNAEQTLAAAADAAKALPETERGAYQRLVTNADMVKSVYESESARRVLIATLSNEAIATDSFAALNVLKAGLEQGKTPLLVAGEMRPIADRLPTLWPLQSMLIGMYAGVGDFDEAMEIAVRSMKAAPADPSPAELATKVLATAGRWAQVIGVAQDWRSRCGAETLVPDQVLAQAYIATGSPARAVEQLNPYFERAAKDPAKWSPICVLRFQALMAGAKTAEAQNYMAPLLEGNATFRDTWRLAAMLPKLDSAVAFHMMEQLEKKTPATSIDERLNLAGSWAHLAGQAKDAAQASAAGKLLDATGAAIIASPKPTSGHWTILGSIREQLGDIAAAETAYRAALKLNDQDAIAANNLAMLVTNRNGDLAEALSLATRAVANERHSQRADFLDTLALVHKQAGQLPEALSAVQQAVKLKDDPSLHVDLVDILIASGRRDESRDAFAILERMYRSVPNPSEKLTKDVARLRAQLL